ncbi:MULTISPECIES: LysR family transcriptional regulator [unclassified Pseudomonas]|uniref:LysR family transcriptional regulator n=1 Tax=unclassified Pseudomonas TaxID=196821 RepID=UPI0013050377|nr:MULTISPECIES: LysR family transcriptional regulator [unclassified Pseudomonas]
MFSRISLDQWQAFVSTVECGGFQQAGEYMFKSQSAVSHSVNRMETLLGQELFLIEGRKAVLTPLGQALLPQAKHLLGSAKKLERLAIQYQPGLCIEHSLAVDMLFPANVLEQALSRFSSVLQGYRVRLHETAVSGAYELLENGKVELGIASSLPKGYMQEFLLNVSLLCVVASDHSLAHFNGELNLADMKDYRQIVVSDSAIRNSQNSSWSGASQCWTVSNLSTALTFVERGLGFAWLPEHMVSDKLASGQLRLVPLCHQRECNVPMYMGFLEEYRFNPEVRLMTDIIREQCRNINSAKADTLALAL